MKMGCVVKGHFIEMPINQSRDIYMTKQSINMNISTNLGGRKAPHIVGESFKFKVFSLHIKKPWTLIFEPRRIKNCLCAQPRRRPACASAASDQRLCYSRTGKNHI